MNKPHNLLICGSFKDAQSYLSIDKWPLRYGRALTIKKAQMTVETETDVFHVFYGDSNQLWSMEIKEFYITENATLRPDFIKIVQTACSRRRIQAIPNYLELLGLNK